MDPEANYEEQRQLYGSTDPDNMERRIELINSMKEWVRHGGFKPAGYKGPAWEPCPNEVESTKLERGQSVSDWIAGGGFGPRPESARSNASDPNIQTLIGKADDSMKESIARARASEPGKFESSGDEATSKIQFRDDALSVDRVGRRLEEIVVNGMHDDEAGDVNGPGGHWYGLVLESGIPGAEYAVISESNSGFFDFARFDTPEEARAEFDSLSKEVAEVFDEYVVDGGDSDTPEEARSEIAEGASKGERVWGPIDHWRAFDRDGNEMLDGYIEAALFSSTDHSDDSGGQPLDKNYSSADIASEALGEMRGDVFTFLADHRALIGDKLALAGHDFWLTRNGHGAGFWDGDWPKDAEKILTDASKSYGSSDLYVGDDGKLYLT